MLGRNVKKKYESERNEKKMKKKLFDSYEREYRRYYKFELKKLNI